ncbi:MAG: hypothetical protein ACJ0KI_02710 [Dehalococcoidia bacterium]
MLHMKSCPKCAGDVSLNKDYYGYYATCLQCGWSKDIDKTKVSVVVTNPDDAEQAYAA